MQNSKFIIDVVRFGGEILANTSPLPTLEQISKYDTALFPMLSRCGNFMTMLSSFKTGVV